MIDFNEYINDTIHTLNSAKVNIMDLSEEDRKTALDLEYEMNKTVEDGATEKFFQVLDEWKSIFIYGNDVYGSCSAPNWLGERVQGVQDSRGQVFVSRE